MVKRKSAKSEIEQAPFQVVTANSESGHMYALCNENQQKRLGSKFSRRRLLHVQKNP